MNILSNIGTQLSELFGSLTPSARIMAGLMMGVIVVSLGWIISTETSDDYEPLLGGIPLSNAEMDRIETAFGDAQLRDYHRVGKQIRIPNGTKDLYLKALSSAEAMPMEWGSYTNRALKENGAFEPASKLEARLATAKEHEFANTLKRMPGIEFAAVRYDEVRKGFGRETDKTCSIELQGPQNQPIPDVTLRRIAEHASKHFAGLRLSQISVLDLGTSNLFNESDDPHSASKNRVLEARQDWEQHFEQKIADVLVGYGDYRLMVNVEIDPTVLHEEEKLAYDPTAITLVSTESRKDTENSKSSPSGPPGSDANGLGNKPQRIESSIAGQTSKTKESEANERRVTGTTGERTEKLGLTPTTVSVSIGIPESYYHQVFAHRQHIANPKAKPEEITAPTDQQLTELKTETEATVRATVETVAMGIRVGDDRKPYVTITSFPDMPPPEIPAPSMASTAMAWFGQSWSTLALLVVVLVSLGMMFSWIKSQGETDSDRKFAEGFGLEVPSNIGDQLDIGNDEQGTEGGRSRNKPEFDVSGGEMKEDLSTLIKENPDAVVNLLKTWIGDAA